MVESDTQDSGSYQSEEFCHRCSRDFPEDELTPINTVINGIEQKEWVCPGCEEDAREDEKPPVRTDGGLAESERPEPKTREHPDGVTVKEAGDCRFVASPSGTVHERREWPGDAHEYDYHPKCGQRLPAGSMWGRVDAKDPREAVTKYDLKPCGKCFKHTHELRKLRRRARRERRSLDTASDRAGEGQP